MTRASHVDASRIRMYDLQFRIAGLELSLQLPALPPLQPFAPLQALKGG
jgi:hypothetical protein